MNIHVAKDGQLLGSYGIVELNEALSVGKISITDLAWMDGEAEWAELSELATKRKLSLRIESPDLVRPPPSPASAPPPPASAPPPPPISDTWFVLRAGQEYGPYTKDAMQQHLKNKKLNADDQVRHEDESTFQPLADVLPRTSVDFKAIVEKIGIVISKLASKSAAIANNLMHNAGPLGKQLIGYTKGNEKIVFGGVGIAGALLLILIFYPGGPSNGEIKEAIERQFSEKFGENAIHFNIDNINKSGCKGADQGGHFCQFEYDLKVKDGFLGNDGRKQHVPETTARFYKDSRGWNVN